MTQDKPKDFPLLECAKKAEEHLATGRANVYQKWTCGYCGSRQTMEEANIFYKRGRCEECQQITEIVNCNYLLELF